MPTASRATAANMTTSGLFILGDGDHEFARDVSGGAERIRFCCLRERKRLLQRYAERTFGVKPPGVGESALGMLLHLE
jgi:hypothetical protein